MNSSKGLLKASTSPREIYVNVNFWMAKLGQVDICIYLCVYIYIHVYHLFVHILSLDES